MAAGYLDATPSGGFRVFWRCPEIDGNLKLAQRPASEAERAIDPNPVRVRVETRGRGGFAIVAPSNGTTHPSGGAYERQSGGFTSIVEITPDERRDLLTLLRALDRIPVAESRPRPAPRHAQGDPASLRAGDDFIARTTWAELLEPCGWCHIRRRADGTDEWRRPGKAHGLSATTNYGGSNRLVAFSSSTPFEPQRAYNLFSAYALLHHADDHSAAARALAALGYGAPRPARRAVPAETGDVSPAIKDVPRRFAAAGDGRYTLAVADSRVALTVDRLRRERHELVGELTVTCSLPGAQTFDGTLSVADFNLSSARA